MLSKRDYFYRIRRRLCRLRGRMLRCWQSKLSPGVELPRGRGFGDSDTPVGSRPVFWDWSPTILGSPCMHSMLMQSCTTMLFRTILNSNAHLCSYAESCTVMLSYAQSCSVMHSHAQSCTVMLSHVQSCTVMLSYAQSCSVMHSHVKSCTVMLSYAQSCLVMLSHAQSCTVMHS